VRLVRVLVTGGSGGLGSNVLTAIVARGVTARVLARDPARLTSARGVEVVQGDARDPAVMRRAAAGCAALFHLVNVNLSQDWIRTTRDLLDAALAACAATNTRLVFPANVWVFGRTGPRQRVAESTPHAPCSARGRARREMEERITSSGVRSVLVRLPEFYGPHVQTLTGPPLLRIARRRTGTWFGPPEVDVELVYMPDAAEALITIGLSDGVDGETFHLPGVAAVTPGAFFALACEVAGGGRARFLPPWVVRAAAPFSREARAFADILHLWTDPVLLDGAKVAARFPGLPATSYRHGLESTIAWLRAHPSARMYYG
jgi:nucleoside-diphosphate-sugar epimerase